MTFGDVWWLESVLFDIWMRRIQWHKRFVISLHESVWVTFHLMPHWLVEAIMQNSRNISNNLFASTSQLMWMWCTVSSFANSQAVHVSNVSSMHMEYPVRGWRNLWLALAWIEIPSRTCLFLFGSWSMCLWHFFRLCLEVYTAITLNDWRSTDRLQDEFTPIGLCADEEI